MRFSSTFSLVLFAALLGIPALAQPAANPPIYNTVKQKLLEGKQVFSYTQTKFDVAGNCEAAKHYDYTWYEMQHSTLEFKDIEAMIAACPHAGAIPMIRLPDAQEWHIQHATDIGVLGIIVPTVDDVDRAREAAKWARYPPVARRSSGSGQARTIWGINGINYPKTINDNMLVVVMIETPTGVANAYDIASVPGIDVVIIGNNDLSVFSGFPQNDDRYQAMVTKVYNDTKRAGKIFGQANAVYATGHPLSNESSPARSGARNAFRTGRNRKREGTNWMPLGRRQPGRNRARRGTRHLPLEKLAYRDESQPGASASRLRPASAYGSSPSRCFPAHGRERKSPRSQARSPPFDQRPAARVGMAECVQYEVIVPPSPSLSALDPNTQAFPVLTPTQIDRIRPLGHIRGVQSGETLYKPNDSAVPFFVVLSGQMEVLRPTLDGERLVVIHNPGCFTGEMTMIAGQRCWVHGRVTAPGEFLELSRDAMLALVARDAELSEILMRAFILRRLLLIREGSGNVVVMGSRHSAQTLQLREFFSRNGHPYTYIDLDTDRTARELLDRFDVKASDVPVVICHGTVLRSPSMQKVADCLGFNVSVDSTRVRDLIIVGAGPAGLAAAVYAASEGLNVLMIESQSPGGQAGSSSKIENYLGFPTGVSGIELATRAITQAQKFGANMLIARSVTRLYGDNRHYQVVLDTGERLSTRAVIIATGAQYNRPKLENLAKFEGNGTYYAATCMESQWCEGEEIAVVGGGNSAGQAAVFLSQTARHVHLLVRAGELSSTMSRYLIQRLTENQSIELHFNTEIVALEGESSLERIAWRDRNTGEISVRDIWHLFLMTGAAPRTEWLRGCVALDDKGFILTGRDLDTTGPQGSNTWPLTRPPQMLETSLPGVFAVGDARSGNVKRVASAVGEGAISVHMVHRALVEL